MVGCCSSSAILRFRVSVSAGAPSPVSRHIIAECLGQAFFELLDAGAEADGAFVGGEQVGLRDARVTAGPVLAAGGPAWVAWILPSRSGCR